LTSHSPDNVVLGAELAESLAAGVGDRVSFLSITGGMGSLLGDEGESNDYLVTGIFRCGYYEYDLGLAYVALDSPLVEGAGLTVEVKLKDRWQDRRAMAAITALPAWKTVAAENAPELVSWRDYNRVFFSALRTEKLMMFILVGLIFIVVGLNIFQSQRRLVLERREEIGLLRALGASEMETRLVFLWDGLLIGLSGAGSGLLVGLLVSFNIAGFFSLLETLVNFFIGIFNAVVGGGAGEFAVFSPQIFYIKEIPSRVVPKEALLIFLFGFLSALLAAWFAPGKAAKTRPAEVLRYE